MIPRIFFFVSLVVFHTQCASLQNLNTDDDPIRVAFYNVENLFDLEDDPNTLDEDFTPNGKQQWTAERFNTKLDRIDQVMAGMDYPVLIGLSEVENKSVLQSLCEYQGFEPLKYNIVHFDSPDQRGIDVALLYQKKQFKVIDSEFVRIPFPDEIVPEEPGYTSRDILVVEGILKKKTKVHVLVAHFPSRRGGVKKSEPKRLHVAGYMRKKVEEIFSKDPGARIILMGDFNDETDNKSIVDVLGALPLGTEYQQGMLYNAFSELDENGEGSYNYRGNWNMLDQVILSGSFFQPDEKLKFSKAIIFKADWMLYKDKKYGARPNRTYGGPRYYGGYSDHLPVYVELEK